MRVGLAVVAIGVAFVAPQAADATTYCVSSPPGCSGTTKATIGDAITAAAGNPGLDTIEIGSGAIGAPLVDAAGNPINFEGVGAQQPQLTTTTVNGTSVLSVGDSGSSVHNLEFLVPAGGDDTGLRLNAGTADQITVVGSSVASGAEGVFLGTGATVSHVTVTLPHSTTLNTIGIEPDGNGDAVTDATIDADIGIDQAAGSGLTLSRISTIAPAGVFITSGTGNLIEDSLLVPTGPHNGNPLGLEVAATSATVSATARNLTVVDGGGHNLGGEGISAYESSGTATLTLENSIVMGFTGLNYDLVDDGAHASISTDYDDWHSTLSFDSAPAITPGPHDLDVTPGFVSPTDVHLAAGSPLIDKGDPAGLPAGASTTDLFGADRDAAGLVPCTYVPDIGAAEFQPAGPTAKPTAAATAAIDAPIAFDGSGSCGPSAETGIASYAWSFDDGTTASGATVQHAFTTPGIHTAELTVSTAAGKTGSATVAVAVQGPPAISISRPAKGGTYVKGQVVKASYHCTASVPATLTSCAGSAASGARIDTRTAGAHTFRVTATESGGMTTTTTVHYTVVVPKLSHVAESAKRWRAGSKLPRIARRVPVGTVFSFVLNVPARVTFTFAREHGGRGGTLTVRGRSGRNRVSFAGRLSRSKGLAPGAYTVAITALAGGARSRTKRLTFAVVSG